MISIIRFKLIPKLSIAVKLTLRITCDDVIQKLYLDGEEQQDPKFRDWQSESTLETSDTLKVIAVRCINSGGGPAGIVASLENKEGKTIFYTNTNWTCSSERENNWYLPEFQATSANWENAVKRADHGGSHWPVIGEISRDADWIWAIRNPLTVYCRGTISIVTGKSCAVIMNLKI